MKNRKNKWRLEILAFLLSLMCILTSCADIGVFRGRTEPGRDAPNPIISSHTAEDPETDTGESKPAPQTTAVEDPPYFPSTGYFGTYPQTPVTDETLLQLLNGLAGELPTPKKAQKWISYQYYDQKRPKDYMWYIDVCYGDGRYRGVYFTEYRCRSTTDGTSATYSDVYDNGYRAGTVYWFAYAPLRWRVLSWDDKEGTALLLCDSIIDAQPFDITDMQGDGTSQYSASTIRTWLNTTFFNTAFSEAEKKMILPTEVDFSEKSMNPYGQPGTIDYEERPFVWENTTDSIFLLSLEDVTNPAYGFPNDYRKPVVSRRAVPTAYALCQGCGVFRDGSVGAWMLRLPHSNDSSHAGAITEDGYVGYYGVYSTYLGIRPAVQIRIQ